MKNEKTIVVLAILALLLATVKPAYATGPYINLPPNPIKVNIKSSSDTCYFYVLLSNVPEGYHVSNGKYPGWCVDKYHTIRKKITYTASLYSSYDPGNPKPDPDWDKVNYILNHKQGSVNAIQEAIWYFIDEINPSDPDAQALINDANANGQGFVPAPGEKMAVVLWIDSKTQIPIIEVVVPLQNVIPEYPLGPILGLASFFAALGIFKRKHP
jgi:hypothetical protein